MKRLPILIMIIVAGSFLAFQTMGTGTKNPPGKYEEILKLVGNMLVQAHFSPPDINDDFSKKIFTKYIGDLDPEKNIFLQSDIATLQKNMKLKLMKKSKAPRLSFFFLQEKFLIQEWKKLRPFVLNYFPSLLILQ